MYGCTNAENYAQPAAPTYRRHRQQQQRVHHRCAVDRPKVATNLLRSSRHDSPGMALVFRTVTRKSGVEKGMRELSKQFREGRRGKGYFGSRRHDVE